MLTSCGESGQRIATTSLRVGSLKPFGASCAADAAAAFFRAATDGFGVGFAFVAFGAAAGFAVFGAAAGFVACGWAGAARPVASYRGVGD